MKISAIVPHRPDEPGLAAALASVRAAAEGLDAQIICIEDSQSKGQSWARNRGLDKAQGEYVFFIDGDDTVEKDFFRHPIAKLEESQADFCIFQYARAPLKRDYNLDGNAAIRAALLPAFAGYSLDDVRRWNAGGALAENREPGTVWRFAFRRSFIESHHIRFDESLRIYEDAMFLCECALYAVKTASLRENLYNYSCNPNGVSSRVTNSPLHLEYKFASLAARVRLDAASSGGFWHYCEASCVFSALEILRVWHAKGIMRYLANARVRAAIAAFPLSFRHPLAAAGAIFLRILSCFSPQS